MFDVFYFDSERKPNLFAHERAVDSVQHAQKLSRTRYFWIVNYLVDYSDWDWLYEPKPWENHQRHAWCSQHQADSGTYLVPRAGYSETNYHTDQILKTLPDMSRWCVPNNIDTAQFDWSWHPMPGEQYEHHFPTQHQSSGGPVYGPGAGPIKLETCQSAVAVPVPDQSHWVVHESIDPDWDWSWHPDALAPPYIYQFGTQHQRTGGPVYHVPGAEHIKFVNQVRIQTNGFATAIYEIDHLDGHAGKIPNTERKVRYFDNYLDTLLRISKTSDHEFIWVCSSVCDYSNFDFTWHPEQWQSEMLHVFASDNQKFGDTFFMHVPTFRQQAENCQLLEWYCINFVNVSVPRRPIPVIYHNQDTHVDIVQTTKWEGPLAVFTTTSCPPAIPAVSLWRPETKTIVPLDLGANSVIVPRAAVADIRTQLYDYAYIDKTYRTQLAPKLQDVIFISYDEPDADANWAMVQSLCPRAQRIHGISGMEKALEAAADASTTPWFYAVFAKTRLEPAFDFLFAPDLMQQPKNYIFNCRNSVNQLEYGHMGVVLYNCNGIKQLNQTGNFGLDYTMSFPNESIPLLSCHGDFATTPYHTWRTAFRECAKLAYFESQLSTVEGQYRLNIWQTQAQGENAEWCLKGAADGVDFFKSTNGNVSVLKQSFKWDWLQEYFVNRYGDLD
jgi:hypothetical protein